MARADLLVSLVRAGASGDRDTLRSTVEALVADERAKSHHTLADRLHRALSSVSVTPPPLATSQGATGQGRDAILELEPRLRLDELMLPLPVRVSGEQLIEEHARAGVLRAHGMEPRHRVLLSGPPGNGKTSFAEAIAESLALPYFIVRYDSLIGSYLGETNTRLRKLFDYVRTQPCVLFFDEFDALGKERGDTHETGEIKRVVSFLLTQLDHLPSYVVVIAATNHAELLDRAVWRRFQMRLGFPAPDKTQRAAFIERLLGQWPEKPRMSPAALAAKLGDVSYAETLEFFQTIRRRHILGLGATSVDEAVRIELDLWASRVTPTGTDDKRSDKAAAAPRRKAKRGTSEDEAGLPATPGSLFEGGTTDEAGA
ncbi:AAA family ATPase [Rhodocista pekingensis]|uniref:AAA family ATPase n=1 Tax=Rhodocista pekingensis TaxID=201185 RepID=A0ABW2KWH2_9PROT